MGGSGEPIGRRTQSDTEDDVAEQAAEAARRVWMVERTYSADSPNILVITYASSDGTQSYQKEWAFNRYGASDVPEVTAAIQVDRDQLVEVAEDQTRKRYAGEAERMAQRHAPDEPV